MSEFVMTGSDMFGRYCLIEQMRYGCPNEKHIYKVISTFRSNCWCEVPYRAASGEVLHDRVEDCISVIHCGICEINVERFRLADVELLPPKAPHMDRLTGIADEMLKEASNATSDRFTPIYAAGALVHYAKEIKKALGEEE